MYRSMNWTHELPKSISFDDCGSETFEEDTPVLCYSCRVSLIVFKILT